MKIEYMSKEYIKLRSDEWYPDDPAHEADIRELMRQQLRDNISVEEAEEELEEMDDYYDGPQEDYDYLEDSYDD